MLKKQEWTKIGIDTAENECRKASKTHTIGKDSSGDNNLLNCERCEARSSPPLGKGKRSEAVSCAANCAQLIRTLRSRRSAPSIPRRALRLALGSGRSRGTFLHLCSTSGRRSWPHKHTRPHAEVLATRKTLILLSNPSGISIPPRNPCASITRWGKWCTLAPPFGTPHPEFKKFRKPTSRLYRSQCSEVNRNTNY